MHMSQPQIVTLKALLNTLRICHKTHTMTTRYGNHDTEDVPAPQDSVPLDRAPPDHTMPRGDNESSDKYSEETNTPCPLAELLGQFQQLKDQSVCMKSATYPSTHMPELMQLTDKLQHLTLTLQPYPNPQPNKEPMHKTMQGYTDTLQAIKREAHLTTTLLQNIPTFNGQESSNIEDRFIDIETTTDILTQSCTCLADAKSHSLTCTLIHEALQAGKCWDEIKGTLRWKLCNANIHTYTSHFMEIHQKDNETLNAYIHCLKTAAK